jgi:type II secretory pathway pseudopilin PulG
MPDGASCDVPLLEGENNFTFWALSSWGDSSRMGSLSARVDTRPPQIEGSLSGTPGEGGWYISPVTFTASASDPQPGSGIEMFSYSLDGGEWTAYVAPITVSEGLHTVTFRAQDLAGHVSEISQSVQVDTLPPQVNASLAGEQANGWYLSQVTFTAAASDDGSGLARIEYALDGASWQAYTAPVTVGDGIHMLRVRALDVAGNQAEMVPLTFQVDGTPPQIRLTPSWYLWERGEVQVRDGESGLVGVEVEIRDPQGRWPKVVRSYEASGGSFAIGIEWDRRFADGTLAPIGSYEVVVKAWDRAGNFARQMASLYIPAPNAPTYTPAPATTTLPVMVEAASPTPVPLQLAMETALPTPTVLVSGFRTVATPPDESQSRTSLTGAGQSPVLWGMAALGAISAATAYALERRRKRKEEEARQAAEAAAEAAWRNASEVARRLQNWLQGQAMLQNALNNSALSDAEKRTVQQQAQTKGIGAALVLLGGLLQVARERYRAMDAKIERAEQQRQQAAAAYQAYRQGEWADPQPQYGEWVPACTPTNPYGIPPATQPALDWLINLYRRDELPGKTALERTQYILEATQSAPFQHFANIPSGDSGFASYYQDSSVWPQSSNQVGHYLTGLDISIRHHLGNDWKSKHFGLAAVIGHELIGDTLDPSGGPGLINSLINAQPGQAQVWACRGCTMAIGNVTEALLTNDVDRHTADGMERPANLSCMIAVFLIRHI